jgi:hypothetical protein
LRSTGCPSRTSPLSYNAAVGSSLNLEPASAKPSADSDPITGAIVTTAPRFDWTVSQVTHRG